jgi:hypothetical protein
VVAFPAFWLSLESAYSGLQGGHAENTVAKNK